MVFLSVRDDLLSLFETLVCLSIVYQYFLSMQSSLAVNENIIPMPKLALTDSYLPFLPRVMLIAKKM